jgi:DNA polymerase IV
VKSERPVRRILHLDLQPFFVSAERSLDPALRGRPLVIGGPDASGRVAAASAEAVTRGVKVGQLMAQARRLCPDGAFKPGDLEAYARVSDEVTRILLEMSRRVERPSVDEAYVDLTRESAHAPHPVTAAERIKDEVQRRLGLDASLGLACSRLAARVSSSMARPRGLLVVLPGYEASFLGGQPVTVLPELPPHLEAALRAAGIATLGQLAAADVTVLAERVGPVAAHHLLAAARTTDEAPIPAALPPPRLQEDAVIRDRRSDVEALRQVVRGLAERAARHLRPYGMGTGHLAVEVRGPGGSRRADRSFDPPIDDEHTLAGIAVAVAEPLLDPAGEARSVHLRLGRFAPPGRQTLLFG